MASVRVRRCFYETFFDGGQSGSSSSDQDQVDYAINHPIMQRLASTKNKRIGEQFISVTKAEINRERQPLDGQSSRITRSRQISVSSLAASSVSSFEDDDDEEAKFLNRSRSLTTHHHLRPLHLSPAQRTRISESVLSPISDKSENDTTTTTTNAPALEAAASVAISAPARRRRPQLDLASSKRNRTPSALNNSDSGISVLSANSLATSSQEVLLLPLPTIASRELNSHEAVSEPDLPFLMPKLKRSPGILQTLGTSFQQHDGRPVSLTLPFPPTTGAPAPCTVKDLADDSLPIDRQSWYHGSITRQDAEKRLKPTLPGTFLVRDSLASHRDYFLAARSENGFLHVKIECNDGNEFSLCTLPERPFESVARLVNHCANVGIYCRHLPPLVIRYPLAEEAF